jgi:hypothetical protein
MIARGFKSVVWVAAVGGAALGCYMLSLQVATERAELAKVERRIIAAKQEIRSLQTELGTRGRLSQLERWNTDVLALSAPASAQFLPSEFTLARLERREPTPQDVTSQIHMAAASDKPAAVRGNEAPVATPTTAAPDPAVRMASAEIPSQAETQTATVRQAKAPAAQPAPTRQAKAQAQPASPLRQASLAAPTASQSSRRIDSRLVDAIGAAARAEKKAGSTGTP